MVKARRSIKDKYLAKLKELEGFKGEPYRDSAGNITIGYGFKDYPTHTISQKEADNLLKGKIKVYEDCVNNSVTIPLTDNQFAALVIFCYNIGCNNFIHSTLLKKLNKGDYSSVPSELYKWNKVKGVEILGLTHRRASEVSIWLEGSKTTNASFIKPDGEKVIRKSTVLSTLGCVSSIMGSISSSTILSLCFSVLFIIIIGYFFYNRYLEGRKYD